MSEPKWLDIEAVRAIHQQLIAAYGGLAGVRDIELLESAIARPRQMVAYGAPGMSELGAAYAFAIIRNHPFLDGNKRTALMAAYTFLQINGIELDAPEPEAAVMIRDLASGKIGEADIARWIEANAKAL